MIQYFQKTNMFSIESDILTNTINCVGAMGKGIALQFKKRNPEMFSIYRKMCFQNQIKIGKIWVYKTEDDWIVNFPTKLHWKDPSKYSYIEKGLIDLRKYLLSEVSPELSIAIPPLGCGYGGLEWNIIVETINKYLGDLDHTVNLFTP